MPPTPRPKAPPPGKKNLPPAALGRRIGRYSLLRLIARGGMGEVYLAATTGIEGAERPCVVKIIRREHASNSSFVARFLDEARVQAQLHHPGVVQVIEADTDEQGEPYVVVEYVEGRSLGEVRSRCADVSYRLSWAEAVALAASTAEALAHIHERVDVSGQPLSIVHRDMSPQNIMVGYGGDVKLIDFGTALGENRRSHTVAGVVFAKPGYVAPEVANGNTGNALVDIYALGVILWELLAGRRFLQGEASDHLAKVAKNQCPLPKLASLVNAPAELDDILAKLTAFHTKDRYPNARSAHRDLARLLSQAPSLSNGERGMRARISQLMNTLYPAEPTSSRSLFAKLVAQARGHHNQENRPPIECEEPVRDTETDDQLLPGTRYRMLGKIGEGAMGHVFEAEHVDLGRKVAIKVLAAHHATSSDYSARFRREARTLSRLSHPNLVTLHDFGQARDGRLYCAMERLEGETLDKVLDREGPLPWKRALRLGAQAASALREAHRVGIVHRDLKPSNLFLCEDGTLKLLDFGVAKKGDESADSNKDLSSFTLFGTPEYMAPEQVTAGQVDERADVYALACVLYEMVTGTLPIAAKSTVALLDAKTKEDPEPCRDRTPLRHIPIEVDRLILRALARRPEKRTPTAARLHDEILAALESPEKTRRRRRTLGRYALFLSITATVLALSAGMVRRYPEMIPRARAALVAALSADTASTTHESSASFTASPQLPAHATPVAITAAVTNPPISLQPLEANPISPSEPSAQERDWTEAIQAARQWADHSSSRPSRLLLARLLLHSGKPQQKLEARALLEELQRQDPSCTETQSLLATATSGALHSSTPSKPQTSPVAQR